MELRRKFVSAKAAVKYMYSDSPTKSCFEECSDLYYGKYNQNFRPIKLQTDDLIKDLPTAYCVPIVDTVPPWEYNAPHVDTIPRTKGSAALPLLR